MKREEKHNIYFTCISNLIGKCGQYHWLNYSQEKGGVDIGLEKLGLSTGMSETDVELGHDGVTELYKQKLLRIHFKWMNYMLYEKYLNKVI